MAISILNNQPIKIWGQNENRFNGSNSDCKYHRDYFLKAECSDPYQLEFLTELGVDAINGGDFSFTPITGLTTSADANLIDAGASFLSDSLVVGMSAALGKYIVSVLNDTTIDVDPETPNYVNGEPYSISWWSQLNTSTAAGQLTMTPNSPLPLEVSLALQPGQMVVGQYYDVTIDIESSEHDVDIALGGNVIKIADSGDVGEFSVSGICTEGELFSIQVRGSSGTTVINSVSAIAQGSFLPVIIDCDSDQIVYSDYKGAQTTVDSGTALFEIDFTLLGSGYTCPEGCYSVGVLELQSDQTVDSASGIPYTQIISDTFTEALATDLPDHTPEIGIGYTGPLSTPVNEIEVGAGTGDISNPSVLTQPEYRIDYSNKTNGNFFIQLRFTDIGTGAAGNFFEIKWRLTSTVSFSESYTLTIVGDLGYRLNNLDNDLIGFNSSLTSDDVIAVLHVDNVIKIYINDILDLEVTDIDTTNNNNTFSTLKIGGGAFGDKTMLSNLIIGEPLSSEDDGFILSDCIDVREEHDCTLAIQSTNSNNAFGFNFEQLAFRPFLRVEGEFRNPSYTTDRTNDIDSLGDTATIYFQSNKVQDMYVYQVPEYLHDAIRIMIGQDSLSVGSNSFTANNQDYNPDWQLIGNKEYDLASVSVSLVNKTENNKNFNC